MTGLFLALTPSLVTTVLYVGFGAAGGLSIAVLFLANSAGGVWAVRHTPRVATSLGAVCLARWWGLEATAYLYVAFVVVLSVITAVHAGRPQAHKRTDGRSATSAAGSRHHARHARTPC